MAESFWNQEDSDFSAHLFLSRILPLHGRYQDRSFFLEILAFWWDKRWSLDDEPERPFSIHKESRIFRSGATLLINWREEVCFPLLSLLSPLAHPSYSMCISLSGFRWFLFFLKIRDCLLFKTLSKRWSFQMKMFLHSSKKCVWEILMFAIFPSSSPSFLNFC